MRPLCKALHEAGCDATIPQIEAYILRGIRSAEQIVKWHQSDFDKTSFEVVGFKKNGFEPHEACEWIKHHVPSHELGILTELGYTLSEAEQLYFTGFNGDIMRRISKR